MLDPADGDYILETPTARRGIVRPSTIASGEGFVSKELKRFLVIIQLGNTHIDRLKSLIPTLQDALARLSTKAPEQAFRSVGADQFGYIIKTDRVPRQIKAALESPGQRLPGKLLGPMPFLSNDDSILILELGPDFFASVGFTRVGTWLQHN